MAQQKRNLVLSRVGAHHTLDALLESDPAARNWDLAISIYDEGFQPDAAHAIDWVHRAGGGKWHGIHAFFEDNPEALERYDYFWLVDDDIETTPGDVDALFDYVAGHGLEIAQPALSADSHCSYLLTLRCPPFSHRQTNFVELMLPVLARPVLARVLPYCAENWSGRGIDWIWYRFASDKRRAAAIIDAIAMAHRRPLRRHLRGRMQEHGVCHDAERARVAGKALFNQYLPIAYSGTLARSGRRLGRAATAAVMFDAYWRQRHRYIAEKWSLRGWVAFVVTHLFVPVRFR